MAASTNGLVTSDGLVIETSAVVSILLNESDAAFFARQIALAPRRVMSAVSVLEATMTTEGRKRPTGALSLDRLLSDAEVDIIPFDPAQLALARSAWRTYGKGNHPAGLNFGDCCSYALAKSLTLPLLCKGLDFSRTDLLTLSPPA